MAFWSKHFQQVAQIESLRRDLEFERRASGELEKLLDRAETDLAELKLEVKAARRSEIKTLRHHADIVGKGVKVPSSFVAINEEPEPETPREFNIVELEQIEAAAYANLQMDTEDNAKGLPVQPQPLDYYIEMIKTDPEKYLN